MNRPVTITGDDVSAEEQAIRYELTILAFRLPDAQSAKTGIETWLDAPGACGRLIGCWEAEHGVLGRVYVLREFGNDAELAAERERAARSSRPFGAGKHLTDLAMHGYAPFPVYATDRDRAVRVGYEIRDYHLIPGWPARNYRRMADQAPGTSSHRPDRGRHVRA